MKKNLYKQKVITDIRRKFEQCLEYNLRLTRVTAPLFVKADTGINDNLNGTERPVTFDIPALNCEAEIVHSLAKWKRQALYDYNIIPHEGIYTNMNAIRRDEELDELHSVYVDQWDWEMVINKEDRTKEFLMNTVCKVYKSIKEICNYISVRYNINFNNLPDKLKCITAQNLVNRYPNLTPKEAEYQIMKDNNLAALFVIGIGDKLTSGNKYDGRSPDYDDWKLNGDLLVYDNVNDRVIELSSMGIRVDKNSLIEQLSKEGCLDRLQYDFHKGILNDTLPLSIGGGIGQSRLCMWILGEKHIKGVQESLW